MNTLASRARPTAPAWPALWRRAAPLAWPLGGIAVMLFVWWLGGLYLAGNPDTLMFASFATGTFFIITMIVLLDALAGMVVTIVSARRDFGVEGIGA